MGVTSAWFALIAIQAWQHGKKQNKLPEPFYFLGATAVMGLAAVVGMVDNRAGTLFAWAMVVGAVVSGQIKVTQPNSESLPFTPAQTPTSKTTGEPLGIYRDASGPIQSGG